MMKRVCNTRFAVCAMLLAVFLLVGGAVAPVCAKENMSAGQAGDPGDGEEIASGGGSIMSSANHAMAPFTDTEKPAASILLIPVISNGALAFQVLYFFVRTVVRR